MRMEFLHFKFNGGCSDNIGRVVDCWAQETNAQMPVPHFLSFYESYPILTFMGITTRLSTGIVE